MIEVILMFFVGGMATGKGGKTPVGAGRVA
jgi:hypothetical protein